MEILIKKDIRSKGLIDTGTLINSIEVKTTVTKDSFSYAIFAEDYFKYVDEENNITEDVQNSAEFKKLESDMEDAFIKELERRIKN